MITEITYHLPTSFTFEIPRSVNRHIEGRFQSVSDVIDALGGCTEIARYMGWQQSRVSEIKRRGKMRARDFRSFIKMAEEKGVPGITADLLADIHWVPSERPLCIKVALS